MSGNTPPRGGKKRQASGTQGAGAGPGQGLARTPDPIPLDRRVHVDRDPDAPISRMRRLADLLPDTVREFGLEEQMEQARAAAAWLRIVAERVPAASGYCRLTALAEGIATVEADEPIVAQELRLRSPELLTLLRREAGVPVRQLRVTTRHV